MERVVRQLVHQEEGGGRLVIPCTATAKIPRSVIASAIQAD